MNLWNKEHCCICDGKLKMFNNQRAAGGTHICEACKKQCSADILPLRLATMTAEEIYAHITELAGDQELIKTSFRETHSILDKQTDAKTLIAVDGDKGWWYIGNRSTPDVFYFNQVVNYYTNCQSHFLEGDKPVNKLANSALDVLDAAGILDKAENLPMEIVVELAHPYIDLVRIPLAEEYPETPAQLEACQELAQEIIHMFDHFCYIFQEQAQTS